jgi:hypothetical protein
LDLHASDVSKDGILFIDSDEGFARLQLDSTKARLNGRTVELRAAPVIREGVVYVPLQVVNEISKDTLSVNGTRLERGSF